MRVKKDLKDLDATDLDILAGTKLYINDSLCPYYRALWNEPKKLSLREKCPNMESFQVRIQSECGKIFSYFTVSGTVRIRLQEKDP